MSSILNDVKHKIGPSGDYEYFDRDITDAINGAFAVLTQLGAGPSQGFRIESETTEWDAFTTYIPLQELVKEYVYKKTRLTFDAPNNSFLISELNEKVDELEWRINVMVDPKEGE